MQDAKRITKINEEDWNDINSNSSCYKFDYAPPFFALPYALAQDSISGEGIHATA